MRVLYDYTAYYEAKKKLPSPDGRHCVICGSKLPKRKRKYCSYQCVQKWVDKLDIKNWSVVRGQAFERDKFTCRKCGEQAPANLLIGDHIKPIFLGGSEFDLNNVQTLCINCSKKKTREEAKLRTNIEKEIRLKIQTRL